MRLCLHMTLSMQRHMRLMGLTCLPAILRMSPREHAGEMPPIHFKGEAHACAPVMQTHREDAEEISCSQPALDTHASAPAEEEDDIPDIEDLELEDHEIDEVRRVVCILHCRASLHSWWLGILQRASSAGWDKRAAVPEGHGSALSKEDDAITSQ